MSDFRVGYHAAESGLGHPRSAYFRLGLTRRLVPGLIIAVVNDRSSIRPGQFMLAQLGALGMITSGAAMAVSNGVVQRLERFDVENR